MSGGVVERVAPGEYRLSGELGFNTAAALWDDIAPLLAADAGRDAWQVDLAAVERADSAGVALLLEWLREARRRGVSLHLASLPAQMLAIARVSGLEQLLTANGVAAERPERV